ncbi:YheC/YheD family endospore coat-associated protein [Siminovitchia fortis]|uniref:YheC/YheD family protein n=1 Tax=Siminovitchia fortis TaxID=254758 RepID=A0A443J2M2_9BACI|nr:YheC/YheD family protein [Siminovitchia fortis]RWR14605.1 YheC/YheD family protein [Siminovitchia fortis]WHY80286.1 YheC/YheD family protein [Siminovitchia fortis]
MRVRYKCEIFDSNEIRLYYPREFKPKGEHRFTSFGSNAAEAECSRHPNGRNVISISSSLAKILGIPEFVSSLCLFDDDETFYLGPLVGIFTSGFTPFQLLPVGERTKNFAKQMSLQASVGAVPFLFGEKHIDWEKGVINGFFYHEHSWKRRIVPFPNVVYDRLPNRLSESRPSFKKVKEKMENDYLIPWYNPGFFNKLELHERLYNDSRAEHYLPETHPFRSFSDIERMVATYGHVYLKQADGSNGERIRQVLYDPEKGDYYCRFFDEKSRLYKYDSIESLINHMYKGKESEKLIVQQGIRLRRIDKKPMDFRVHVNKDENGHWKVSAIAAKIAGEGSPTTHTRFGGVVRSLEEVFPEEEERETFRNKLHKAALDLAAAIEDNIGGIVGEIGFDLGIDRNGKIWMFEANSKPGRQIFSHPGLKESDTLTSKLALAFAVHLTEKTIHSPQLLWEG